MLDDDRDLLERLGGPPAVAEIVQEVYRRVLQDTELAPFFAHTSMERLSKMQYEFIVAALDGPVSYSGSELTAAHKGRGISGAHFANFCGYFADALEERGVDSQDLNLALSHLATFKDKVVGTTNSDG